MVLLCRRQRKSLVVRHLRYLWLLGIIEMILSSILELKLYILFSTLMKWIIVCHFVTWGRILIVARLHRVKLIWLLLVVWTYRLRIQHSVYARAKMFSHSCYWLSDLILVICDCETPLFIFLNLSFIVPWRREFIFFFNMNRSKRLLSMVFIVSIAILPCIIWVGSWLRNTIVFLGKFVFLHLSILCSFCLLNSSHLTCSNFILFARIVRLLRNHFAKDSLNTRLFWNILQWTVQRCILLTRSSVLQLTCWCI